MLSSSLIGNLIISIINVTRLLKSKKKVKININSNKGEEHPDISKIYFNINQN
jgi:hypothetical protein